MLKGLVPSFFVRCLIGASFPFLREMELVGDQMLKLEETGCLVCQTTIPLVEQYLKQFLRFQLEAADKPMV